MMRNAFLLLFLATMVFKSYGQKEDRYSAKLSPAFHEVLLKKVPDDSIDLVISYQNIEKLKHTGRVLNEYKNAHVSTIRVAPKLIASFVSDTNVLFIDIQRKPKAELTTGAFDLST